jgi:asparagine synthase (glutamine-hydrolysing)
MDANHHLFQAETMLSKTLIKTLSLNTKKHLRPNCGILFSGGVDSSLVAVLSSKYLPDITLITVGFEYSNDVKWADTAAGLLSLKNNLHIKIIDLAEMGSIIPRILEVLKTDDPMTISLGIPLYIACIEAKKNNIDLLLAGQGADELFGGYQRYRAINGMDALQDAITADVERLPERDIKRDNTIARAAGVELAAPYLESEVIEFGLSIPPELKVREVDGELAGKYILRKAAETMIPGEIAWRNKKALQYGSGVWGALGKLARTAGFKKQDKGYIRKYLYSVAEKNRIELDVTS